MPIDDLKNILDKAKNEGKKHLSVLDNDDKTCGLNEVCIVEGTLLLELSQQKKKGFLQAITIADKMPLDDLMTILKEAQESSAKDVSILDYVGKTHVLNQIRSGDGTLGFELCEEIKKLKNTKTGKDHKPSKTSKQPKYFEFRKYLESIPLNPNNYSSAINTTIKKLLQLPENAKDFEGLNTNLWEIEDPAELEKVLKILFEDKIKNYDGYAKFIEMNERSSKTHFNALKKYLEFLQSKRT